MIRNRGHSRDQILPSSWPEAARPEIDRAIRAIQEPLITVEVSRCDPDLGPRSRLLDDCPDPCRPLRRDSVFAKCRPPLRVEGGRRFLVERTDDPVSKSADASPRGSTTQHPPPFSDGFQTNHCLSSGQYRIALPNWSTRRSAFPRSVSARSTRTMDWSLAIGSSGAEDRRSAAFSRE